MAHNIPLDLYKIFCAVVRMGNMSLAAKSLYISQPAVSMSIRQLEEKLGAPLLIRTTKGVRATPEGAVLYEYLEQALSLVSTGENKFLELVQLKAGEIKIGASDTVIANVLMPYLEQYAREYPQISIKVTNKTTYESLRLLKNGLVDLCFINLPIEEDRDLEVIPIMEIQDCLVGGVKYKALATQGLDFSQIGNYPLLLLEELSNSRRQQNAFAQKQGVLLRPILELGSSDLLMSFAKINLGLTFTTREFSQDLIDGKQLFEIPLRPPLPKRHIGIVRLKNVALSHAAKHFADLFLVKNNTSSPAQAETPDRGK